jgi:O-antigen ligase
MVTFNPFNNKTLKILFLSTIVLIGSLLIGILSGLFSPFWVLAGIAALGFFFVLIKIPELGILVIVFITANFIDPERLPLLTLGPISLHITDLILLFLIAIVLVKSLIVPGFHLKLTPLAFPLLWFSLATIISVITASHNPSFDMHWILRKYRPLFYYFIFFAVINLIRKKKQLKVLINGLLLLAVLGSLAFLVQTIDPNLQLIKTKSADLKTAGEVFLGVVRTFSLADKLIYPMLIISFSLLIFRKGLNSRLRILIVAVLAIGLFLTFQRNLWLTLISMIILMVIILSWEYKIRILNFFLIGLMILIILISIPGTSIINYMDAGLNRITRGLDPQTLAQDDSTQWRVMEMGYAFQSIAQHPLLGVGLGNFYRPAVTRDVYTPYTLRYYIHIAYLWVFIDMGLVGFIPFIWLYGLIIFRGFTHWYKVEDPKLRAIALGITLGILGCSISNFFMPNYIQDWALVVYPILFGINELIFQWEIPVSPKLAGER